MSSTEEHSRTQGSNKATFRNVTNAEKEKINQIVKAKMDNNEFLYTTLRADFLVTFRERQWAGGKLDNFIERKVKERESYTKISEANQVILNTVLKYYTTISNEEYKYYYKAPFVVENGNIILYYKCTNKCNVTIQCKIIDGKFLCGYADGIHSAECQCRCANRNSVAQDPSIDIISQWEIYRTDKNFKIEDILPYFESNHPGIDDNVKSLTCHKMIEILKKEQKDRKPSPFQVGMEKFKDYIFLYSGHFGIEVYGHPNIYQHMEAAKFILLDSTYDIVAIKAIEGNQLLTIMALEPVTNAYLPIIHCIMKGKAWEDYLKLLRNLGPYINFDKSTILSCDFEQAMINALKHFGVSEDQISGCLFHFRQAILKNFKQKVGESDELSKAVLTVAMSLPFLQEDYYKYVIHKLTQFPEEYAKLNTFGEYLKRIWLNKYTIVQKISRLELGVMTNNGLESYHGRLENQIHDNPPKSLDDVISILWTVDNYYYEKYLELERKHKKIDRTVRTEKFAVNFKEAITKIQTVIPSFIYMDPILSNNHEVSKSHNEVPSEESKDLSEIQTRLNTTNFREPQTSEDTGKVDSVSYTKLFENRANQISNDTLQVKRKLVACKRSKQKVLKTKSPTMPKRLQKIPRALLSFLNEQ